jgi:hypothetical protein
MRDLYDSFSYFILLSLAFWLCCAPILLGFGFLAMPILYWPVFLLSTILVPPALTTLFALSDPREAVSRKEWSAVPAYFASVFVRSWKVALGTIVPLVMIAWNISYFAGSGHLLEFLIPLWAVMCIFMFLLTLYCFSLAGTHESGLRNAFRGAMFTLVKYPFRGIGMALFLLVIGYMGALALLPMLLIGPPFVATIVNRFVFDALEVHVIDPEAPTDERALERERGINMERGLIDRVMRRGKE